MNELGGYRNSFSVALTGLDIDAKAAFAQAAFWDACPVRTRLTSQRLDSRVIRTDKADPETQEEATAVWRLTVKDADERKVGRAFSDAMVQTALAGIPGMYAWVVDRRRRHRSACTARPKVSSELVPQYVHMSARHEQLVESVAPVGARFVANRRQRLRRARRDRPLTCRSVGWSERVPATRAAMPTSACTHATTRGGPGSTMHSPSTGLRELLPEAAESRDRAVSLSGHSFAQLRARRPPRGGGGGIDPPGRPGQGSGRVAPRAGDGRPRFGDRSAAALI